MWILILFGLLSINSYAMRPGVSSSSSVSTAAAPAISAAPLSYDNKRYAERMVKFFGLLRKAGRVTVFPMDENADYFWILQDECVQISTLLHKTIDKQHCNVSKNLRNFYTLLNIALLANQRVVFFASKVGEIFHFALDGKRTDFYNEHENHYCLFTAVEYLMFGNYNVDRLEFVVQRRCASKYFKFKDKQDLLACLHEAFAECKKVEFQDSKSLIWRHCISDEQEFFDFIMKLVKDKKLTLEGGQEINLSKEVSLEDYEKKEITEKGERLHARQSLQDCKTRKERRNLWNNVKWIFADLSKIWGQMHQDSDRSLDAVQWSESLFRNVIAYTKRDRSQVTKNQTLSFKFVLTFDRLYKFDNYYMKHYCIVNKKELNSEKMVVSRDSVITYEDLMMEVNLDSVHKKFICCKFREIAKSDGHEVMEYEIMRNGDFAVFRCCDEANKSYMEHLLRYAELLLRYAEADKKVNLPLFNFVEGGCPAGFFKIVDRILGYTCSPDAPISVPTASAPAISAVAAPVNRSADSSAPATAPAAPSAAAVTTSSVVAPSAAPSVTSAAFLDPPDSNIVFAAPVETIPLDEDVDTERACYYSFLLVESLPKNLTMNEECFEQYKLFDSQYWKFVAEYNKLSDEYVSIEESYGDLRQQFSEYFNSQLYEEVFSKDLQLGQDCGRISRGFETLKQDYETLSQDYVHQGSDRRYQALNLQFLSFVHQFQEVNKEFSEFNKEFSEINKRCFESCFAQKQYSKLSKQFNALNVQYRELSQGLW